MRHLLVKIRQHSPIILLTAGIALAFLFVSYNKYDLGFVQQLDNYLYDARLNLTMPGTVDPTIVIVDIDEASLAEIGRWPWSRDKLAHLVTELFEYYKVSMIGFDIFFREPDESSGYRILKQLGKQELAGVPQYLGRLDELQAQLDFDKLFSDSLARGPVVMGYTFFAAQESNARIRDGVLPPPVITAAQVEGKFIPAQHYTGYGANLPEIQANAVGAGHTTPSLDTDGVVRRVPMLIEFDGDYYESLSLAMTRLILGADRVEPVFAAAAASGSAMPALEGLRLNDVLIPVDAHIQTLVPYRGGAHSFPYVSAADIIHGRADPKVLEGSVVLVGTSAKGLVDLRPAPVSSEFPGVEVHANLISGILDQRLKTANDNTEFIGTLSLLLTGMALVLVLPLLSPIPATVFTAAMLAAVLGSNYYLWTQDNLVVPLALNLLLILLVYLLNMAYGFFIVGRAMRQLSHLFGQYLPKELVEEMKEDPTAYNQLAQNREMTVLFTDIRSFTTISEGLSPEDLSAMLNSYLTPMTQIIHDHRGTIDKYIGDAVMAFWGAPLADPDHARHALYTGLAMLERLNAIREDFKERGWPEIRIGVGINTGVMSVGDMGSKFRMSYTVLGDAVNLGSRLEGLTKTYGVEIIVSETTRAAVPDYVYRELDLVKVKGKEQPIAIFEPIAPASEISDNELRELDASDQALTDYRAQDWDEAERQFRQLQALSPGRALYGIYLERIAEFRIHPPGRDWDGVYTHKTK